MTANTDHGKKPYVLDIESTTVDNDNFRTTLWTGEHLQLTVMAIPVGGDIGLEAHPNNDQFLRLEQGKGLVEMGPAEDDLNFREEVEDDWAILVPAGTWHNVTNIGDVPMKVYALYGPADHLPGTVHATQADAEADPNED
ncbi:MAG: cupin domain-containing protein [Micropruina sp.]|uniref:cupin domain-containing protein n=1 Tax=Micropruina sp. TaxID=2737536 RepID=UPI0039E579F5